jgi:hypothetical protein
MKTPCFTFFAQALPSLVVAAFLGGCFLSTNEPRYKEFHLMDFKNEDYVIYEVEDSVKRKKLYFGI